MTTRPRPRPRKSPRPHPIKAATALESNTPSVTYSEGKDALGRTRVVGLKTHEAGVNPKDKIGATKIDLTLLSVSAKVEWAKAAMLGGRKYGEYNWRVEPVLMRTYLGAIMRHTDAVLESEDIDPESLANHMGHVMASAAIIIDALRQNKLIDDRPINGTPEVLEEAGKWVKEFLNGTARRR